MSRISVRRGTLPAAAFLVSCFLIYCPLFAQSQDLPDAPTARPQTPGQPESAPQNAPQNMPPAAPNGTMPNPPPGGPEPTGPTVLFDTSMGRMTCRLFDKQAPVTVANFVGLATGTKNWTDPTTKQAMHGKPFYDGTTFHRVIPGFMIQGGDPTGTGMGDPGFSFNDEFSPDLNFDVPGRLAMANSGPNTDGSQFFITEAPDQDLDQKYTIFGQCDAHSVIVVQSIARVNRDDKDKPLEPVILQKVTVIPAGQPVPGATAPGTTAPGTAAPGTTPPGSAGPGAGAATPQS
ncbi:MAG TPA: peptidylprolyl isomerase [Acidobacteriaceae bacterium]|nr:peptidylprolyl isomerase [Acidobacteriaceae bacterium]